MLHRNVCKIIHCRKYSSKVKRVFSSKEIRQVFLDFFTNRYEHKFIKSSPVVPFCDPTLAFVNAGMNQFKSVFLGKVTPPHKKVVNSQKCIRVGGKHNDISVVGKDGYHHTFFEMLGNWSFGDYFKRETCQMALECLTDVLKIDSSRLYVTYFGGDEKLNLPADLECFEIWRSLGFQENRILPFGSSDNFWEMGPTGPCGPCSEIHFDHLPNGSMDRSKYVNTGRTDLTELWNLVFIEYSRNIDESLTPLSGRYVDTGMGMERLTAILQGKTSNYDTDLFMPIIDVISKVCRSPQYKGSFDENSGSYQLDTAYRILADHSRMIIACLSDGMLPDQNQKLRRVIRTILLLSENNFGNENLLHETIPVVAEILGSTYPEMIKKQNDVLDIIEHEREIFKSLRENSSKDIKEILVRYPRVNEIDFIDFPGFVSAFKELQLEKPSFKNGIIPGKFMFKLHDTFGLNDEIIKKIAEIEDLKLDLEGLQLEIHNSKQRSKNMFNVFSSSEEGFFRITDSILKFSSICPNTDDSAKYVYEFNENQNTFDIPKLNVSVLGIFENGKEVKSISSKSENKVGIITDKTNFYCESGGQESDKGIISIDSEIQFEVRAVEKINDCILHFGQFSRSVRDYQLNIGEKVDLLVDHIHRTNNILHHTGTHLLNAAVRNLLRKVIYQVSSSVTSKNLKLELGIIGKKLAFEDIVSIENLVKQTISLGLPVNVTVNTAREILEMPDVTTVPGEIYSEFGLRLLEIVGSDSNFVSRELCCGTHASNTSQLGEFCITNFKQTSRARYVFTAVCGNEAKQSVISSNELLKRIESLEKKFKNDPERFSVIERDLKKLRSALMHGNSISSYIMKMECLEKINEISKMVREISRSNLKNFIEMEMMNILQQYPKEKSPFIIHFLKCSSLMEAVPLQKATKVCSDRPVLVISLEDGKIKARCCVPKDKISNNFSAIRWLKEFSDVFSGQLSPPKGQNANEVCNMKSKKVLASIFQDQLEVAMKKAEEFALKYLRL